MDDPGESVTEGSTQASEATIEPPKSNWGILRYLGPSFAVVAVTIGSGELIATTATGAEIGMVVLWFLLLSLVVKVGIQYQYSKYGLISGKTPHEVFDEIPGEIFGHSWAWWWMVFFWIVVANLLYMGIFFAAATMLHYITLQTVPISICLLIVLAMTIAPALKGYDFVEDFSTVIVSLLTIITVIAAGLSFATPYGLSAGEFAYGLSGNFPSGGIGALFGAVGITGIATNELVAYAAYVQETGYGSHAGPRDSEGWQARMKGWINIMKIDVLVSLLLMVIITLSFFIIGATVVAGQGDYPSGAELAVFLAESYRSLFGAVGYWTLLIGGFFALYSTAFGETQVVGVVYPDWVKDTDWGEDIDPDRISTFAVIAMPTVWYIGGYVQGVITPLIVLGGTLFAISYIPEIVAAAWTLRAEQDEPEELRTTGWEKAGVWISIIGSGLMVGTLLVVEIGLL